MALKNFSFKKNWVGSEVAGMKIAFFAIFDQTWAHILAPKRPKYGIPEAQLEFSVPKKDRSMLLPSMWLKDWVTTVKTSKLVTFCYFWPKTSKNLALISLKYGVSS